MTTYYKSGSHTECFFTGTVQSAQTFSKKGNDYTLLMIQSAQTYQNGHGELRTVAQTIPLWLSGKMGIDNGTVVAVQGKMGLTTGIPKDEQNQYETNQILITDATLSVLGQAPGSINGINSATIVGRVGKTREIKGQNPGFAFSLAVNRSVKTGDEYKDEKDWHECILWGKRAESAKDKISTGDLVMVTGRLNMRGFKLGNGQKMLLTFNALDYNVFVHKEKSKAQSGSALQASATSLQAPATALKTGGTPLGGSAPAQAAPAPQQTRPVQQAPSQFVGGGTPMTGFAPSQPANFS